MKRPFFVPFLSLLLFLLPFSVYGHKLNTYALREGNRVFGECYFADGSPCKNAKVEVYGVEGQKILEAKTDERGRYSFHVQETPIKIVISAGEGHRVEYFLNKGGSKPAKRGDYTVADEERLRRIMEEVIESKMEGIRAGIIDLKKEMGKMNLRDIIGGIGYIFGVWGIITLLLRRKNAS